MPRKKVIIIGAGLAGLSAGIHLQNSGIATEIFELSGQAGGMFSAWERKHYRFDGCIHWMVGTKPGDPINKLYREIDLLTEDTPIYNAESIEVEIGGTMYEIPLKLDAFKQFLLSLAPEDTSMIKDFCHNIEEIKNTTMPMRAPENLSELFRLFTESWGFVKLVFKYANKTVTEYADRFHNNTVKSIIYSLMPPEYSLMGLFMMLGTRMGENAGYPIGGAYEAVRRIVQKYRALGGVIHYHSKVDEIIIKNGTVAGVRSKGEIYPADAVIAACDMYDTLRNMLGGKYPHPQLDTMLEAAELFPPLILVSYGLKRRFDIPFAITFECPEGIQTAPGHIETQLSFRSFEFDPTSAPENCSSVMAMFTSELDYWQTLRSSDISEYRLKKEDFSDQVTEMLNKRIPGFKDAIEVIDVATPATYVRYANLYKGSWEGFAPTPAAVRTNIRKTIDGIKGLYLCGQWTTPGGGICTAVASGKDAAASVLKANK
jgi:phytoene desaturase